MKRLEAVLRNTVRHAVLGLGTAWTLASGDLLLDRFRHPRAVTGFDLALPYLWASVLVFALAAFALRWLLSAVLRRERPGRRDLAMAWTLPALAVALVFAQLAELLKVPEGGKGFVLLVLLAFLSGSLVAVAVWTGLRLDSGGLEERALSLLVLGTAWGLHVPLLIAVAPAGRWIPVTLTALAVGLVGALALAPRRPLWRVVSLAWLLLAAPLCALAARAPERPRAAGDPAVAPVVLVTVDTLRSDQLRVYDPTGVRTPGIERMAEEGIVFTEAYSPAPWTLPGIGSILTGVSPAVHGAIRPGGVLPEELPTLGGFLRRHGYRTAAFVKNPNLTRQTSLRRDFDIYRAFPRTLGLSLGSKLLFKLNTRVPRLDVGTASLTDLAIGFVKEHRDEPFFLWVHYLDPHSPYTPPARLRPQGEAPPGLERGLLSAVEIREGYHALTAEERSWVRGLYRGEIRWMDENLARLWRALDRTGLWDDALILLTSDHGEELWDHGGFFHGHSLHRELLQVPLIVKLPGSAVRTRIHRRVTTESVTPTLLELTGVPFRRQRFTAPSLVRLWREPDAPELLAPAPPMLATGIIYYEDQTALLTDRIKYIRKATTGTEELYELESDPTEQHSLAAQEPEIVESARRQLAALQADLGELRRRYGLTDSLTPLDLDRTSRRQLQALGYVR
jgi:arylsulfatase A-like enzyme